MRHHHNPVPFTALPPSNARSHHTMRLRRHVAAGAVRAGKGQGKLPGGAAGLALPLPLAVRRRLGWRCMSWLQLTPHECCVTRRAPLGPTRCVHAHTRCKHGAHTEACKATLHAHAPPPAPAGVSINVDPTTWNSRRIYASIGITAPVDIVWEALTDYDNLGTFIPSLVENRCIKRQGKTATLYQVLLCPAPGCGVQAPVCWPFEEAAGGSGWQCPLLLARVCGCRPCRAHLGRSLQ